MGNFLPVGNGGAFDIFAPESLFEDIDELEFLEPVVAFEEALLDGSEARVVRLAVFNRDDADLLVEFWRLARDYDAGPALALVSMLIGATYGDDAFGMVLDA